MSIIQTQKPAFQSLTLQGAAVIAVSIAARRLGVALPHEIAEGLVNSISDLMMTIGFIGVAVGRSRARGPLE